MKAGLVSLPPTEGEPAPPFPAVVSVRHGRSDTPPLRRGMAPWVVGLGWRLASGLSVLLTISLVVFLATQALPSDPARVVLGPDATEAAITKLRAQLRLDQPLPVQYVSWLTHAATGDFGRSLDSGKPVGPYVARRAVNSLVLALYTLAVAMPLAFWLGLTLARHRETKVDRSVSSLLMLLMTLPSYIIGIMLVVLLATTIFPVLPAASLLDPERSVFLQPSYLALPALTLLLSILPFLTLTVRASVIDVLDTDYVGAARLRGVPEGRLLWRHVLPNAAIPAVQGLALTARVLLGGIVIVEVLFSYPGLGSALNAAIQLRDLPMIQAITLLISAMIVLVNLLADALAILLTPKLRAAPRPVSPAEKPP